MIMNLKRAKLMASGMSVCFFAIHLLMIIIFWQCGVIPMVRFNIFSIIFYILIQWIIYKGYMEIYVVAVYFEVAIHMSLAVLFTGWDSGFQITLIGMNVLAFYAEYVGRTLRIRYTRMLPIGILGMVLYVGTYIYIRIYPPVYDLPDKATFWLNIIWGIVVFGINIVVMEEFVLITVRSEDKLAEQMSHDKLTGLPNRYYMTDYLDRVFGNGALTDYWMAIADIDDFKKINDTYGHNCGDYVLKKVADIIRKQKDLEFCRWGGEEFIFVGRTEKSFEDEINKLENLRNMVGDYDFSYEGEHFKVTLTMGMSLFGENKTVDAWISNADEKLYNGKLNGKNRIVV